MAPLIMAVEFAAFGFFMFNLGLFIPTLRTLWSRGRTKRLRAVRGGDGAISRDDIRKELCRDPVATEMFMNDSTPEDVQRYLYLEAERRATLRRHRRLADDENDFFAPPRAGGPDPGFRGCRS